MSETKEQEPTIGILENSGTALCERWITPLMRRNIHVRLIKPSECLQAEKALEGLSGLLLPGGDTNIHPNFCDRLYQFSPAGHDTTRDMSAIKLIEHAHAIDLPTLGICRGMQEMVSTFKGRIERLPDDLHATGYAYKGDHKKMDSPIHPITVSDQGKLYHILFDCLDSERKTEVNSIHYEGLTLENWNRQTPNGEHLRQHLQIEAIAPDDVIEAISAKDRSFFIGVQAHFEFQGCLHAALFDAFSQAIAAHKRN